MQEHKKLQLIGAFDREDNLRTELIIPLFRKMNYIVYDNQGADEYGTDVILKKTGILDNDEYTSVVLKKGDIDNKSGKQTSIVTTIQHQVTQAAKAALEHPEIKKNTYPNSVWIITNGKISKSAKNIFSKLLKEQFNSLANVDYIDNNKLKELIDKFWPEFYNDRRPFLSQYSEKLKKDLVGINLTDIGDQNRDLDTILIPQLLIQKSNIHDTDEPEIDIKRKPLSPIELLAKKTNFIFVTGEAGSGKSTLIKRLAIDISEKDKGTPIVVSARKLTNADISLPNIISILCEDKCGIPNHEIIEEINKTNMILLVDGFDEVRSDENQQVIIENLNKLILEHNNLDKVIIASRPLSTKNTLSPIENYKTFQVQPVENNQINKFFIRWFGNNLIAKKLYEELNRKCLLERLPKTPLTLTLLAILYETKEDIPTTLTELYRMFTELLLGKWDNKKGINTLKDSQVKFGLLSSISWNMHNDGIYEISQDRLLHLSDDYIKNKLGDTTLNSQHLVQEIIDRSGLLVLTPSGIKFKHLSFQEFFCSQEIYCKAIFRDNLSMWLHDSWWSDVLFFSAGSIKSIDDYIDILTNDSSDDIFEKLLNIGGMLQAAYETTIKNKRKLINYTASKVPGIINEAIDDLKENTSTPIPLFIPYLAIIDMLTDNYTSTYLESALKSCLEIPTKANEKYDADLALKNFFLSASLSKSGNIEGLLEISTSTEIDNPIILLLSDMLLGEYEEKYNDKKLSDVHKKVRRKIKNNIANVKKLIHAKIKKD